MSGDAAAADVLATISYLNSFTTSNEIKTNEGSGKGGIVGGSGDGGDTIKYKCATLEKENFQLNCGCWQLIKLEDIHN